MPEVELLSVVGTAALAAVGRDRVGIRPPTDEGRALDVPVDRLVVQAVATTVLADGPAAQD